MSIAFLSACGGGSSNNSNPPIVSVDANGNCSKNIFARIITVSSQREKAFLQSASSANIKDLKASCDVFRAHHAETVTCGASSQGGSAITIQATDHYVYCDSIDRIVTGKG